MWLRGTYQIGMPSYPLVRNNPSMKKLAGNPEYDRFMSEFKPSPGLTAAPPMMQIIGFVMFASTK